MPNLGGMHFIKAPVFPWRRFNVQDVMLGPEMRSTGEVMGVGRSFGEAYAKALIGAGMRSHPGIAAKMFRTLADLDINLRMIATSPIKVSCMVAKSEVPRAVQALHAAFELEKDPSEEEAVRG